MATDFENGANQVIKQVPTVKNLIYSESQPTKSSNFSKDNQFFVEVKCANENSLNCYPNNPSHLKSKYKELLTLFKQIFLLKFLLDTNTFFYRLS